MSRRARWSSDGPAGSNFHELVVLPTFAPHLARDHDMAGPRQAVEGPVSQAGEAVPQETEGGSQGAAVVVDPAVERRFFVHVTTSFLKTIRYGKSEKQKVQEATLQTSAQHPVLAMTRSEFVTATLAAHDLHERYLPGAINGPAFKIHWSGSPGGKTRAQSITTNENWSTLQQQLRTAKSSVTVVEVVFDLDSMAGWASRKRPLSPGLLGDGSDQAEITYGTAVPHVSSYSNEQRVQGAAAAEISSTWRCATHQTPCYITSGGEHVQISPLRLKQWAAAVVAGTSGAADPPPSSLLELWTGVKTSPVRPRGRTGPYASAGPADASIQLAQLFTPFVPVLASALERGLAVPGLAPVPAPPAFPPVSALVPATSSDSGAHRASSPPPEVDEELMCCLEAFGHDRKVPMQLIDEAIGKLSELCYTPDALGTVPITRLQELLPQFAEGQLYALKSYAGSWYARIVTKRARCL